MSNRKPKRIQRRRIKGWKMPRNTKYVGRPSKWGNPFKVKEWYQNIETLLWIHPDMKTGLFHMKFFHGAYIRKLKVSLKFYRRLALRQYKAGALEELRGKNLACWCPLKDKDGNQVPCHADILLDISNS